MTTHSTFIPLAAVAHPSDADAVHRLTMGLFRSATLPGEPGERRAGANILWRREQDGILVTSDLAATDLPDGAASWTTETTDFAAGQKVRFVATVDAVARVRGRDIPVSDVTKWFMDKAFDAFIVIQFQSVGSVTALRRGARLEQITLTGEAHVANPTELARLLREGIGRSKAFGCGMLTAVAA